MILSVYVITFSYDNTKERVKSGVASEGERVSRMSRKSKTDEFFCRMQIALGDYYESESTGIFYQCGRMPEFH